MFAHDPEAKTLEAELRWLTGRLGEVRNFDALMPRADEDARRRLGHARDQAMAVLRTDLASARVRGMMLDLAEWLAIGDWWIRPPRSGLPAEDVTWFARDALRKLHKALKRRGKGLAARGPKERHQVRIIAKKLRYASDFFVSLFPSPEAARHHERFVAALSLLQDSLGDLNDLGLERRILKRLPGADERRHRHHRRKRKLLQRAERGYDQLIDARKFWRVDLPLAA